MDRQTYAIARAVWIDAVSIDEWTDVESLKSEPDHVIVSVGHLLKETDFSYTLGLNHDSVEGMASCCMVIPKAFLLAPIEIIWNP